MFDFQSVSSYSPGDLAADKRKTETGNTMREKPPPAGPMIATELFNQRDYSTFQFQNQSQPLRAVPPNDQPTPQKPPFLLSVLTINGLQTLNSNFERIASQIAGFFYGNRKEKPADDEKQRRGLNDFFTLDFLGERKVEESNQSGFGDGSG
jgi:hypothetical protein